MSNFTVGEICDAEQLLERIPRAEWPRIHYQLCEREWPPELGAKPSDFDDYIGTKPHPTSIYLELIENRIGQKAVLRYMHETRYGISEQMFEDWWDAIGCRLCHENELRQIIRTESGRVCAELLEEEKTENLEQQCEQCGEKSGKKRSAPGYFVLLFGAVILTLLILGAFLQTL